MKSLNLHFVGIGGSGMSALAQLMRAHNCMVTGSDQNDSAKLDMLRAEGIKVHVGHDKKNLTLKNYDYLVYSSAVSKDNPEIKGAQKRGVAVCSYPQAIGLLTKKFKTIIICGTHGKTTTTGMIAAEFIKNNFDPTVVIGAETKELNNNNYRKGKGEYLILEACEYREAFLNYRADYILINNIEPDHLDFFKNKKRYLNAFAKLLQKNKNAVIIANKEDKNIKEVLSKVNAKAVIYFDSKSKLKNKLKLQIPGEHNVLNALAALTVSQTLNLDLNKSLSALNSFIGAKRRQEILGKIGKSLVIDDYGHHPTEIQATLSALKDKYGKNSKIFCVFQPHQFSRTKALLKEFAKSFKDADVVVIPNILNVRDTKKDLESISVTKLVDSINKHSKNAIDGLDLQNTLQLLKNNYKEYDVILTLGAGNINLLAEKFLKDVSK